jgi:hypothetical protein
MHDQAGSGPGGQEVDLPPDFEQRYGLIHPDHSGVDVPRLRRHHQAVVRRLRRELKRRRELEEECERLHRALVTAIVAYDIAPGTVERWMTGGRASGGGAFGAWLVDVAGGDDNPDDG